jgi:predicted transposase YbfD/YdcC
MIVSIEQFGKDKKVWLKTFLKLPNGIPSHDTLGDVFSRLSIREFEQCFLNWVNSLVKVEGSDIIPIDGKTLRRSHDRRKGHAAIHMISAWSTRNQMVLGQRKIDDKSNEITAIPALLKMLDITGSTVTIDAMGCQRKIAEQIYTQGGNYVLAVKENQGKLYQRREEIFEASKGENAKAMWIRSHETLEKDHGRIEH